MIAASSPHHNIRLPSTSGICSIVAADALEGVDPQALIELRRRAVRRVVRYGSRFVGTDQLGRKYRRRVMTARLPRSDELYAHPRADC